MQSLLIPGLKPPEVKLLGNDDLSWTGNISGNALYFQKFTVTRGGFLRDIRVKAQNAAYNIMVAVYDDLAGAPNNLLTSSQGIKTIVNWNTILIPQIHLDVGATYWLASVTDAYVVYYKGGSSATLYRINPFTYGTAFPSPPSGLATYANYDIALAGWGYKS